MSDALSITASSMPAAARPGGPLKRSASRDSGVGVGQDDGWEKDAVSFQSCLGEIEGASPETMCQWQSGLIEDSGVFPADTQPALAERLKEASAFTGGDIILTEEATSIAIDVLPVPVQVHDDSLPDREYQVVEKGNITTFCEELEKCSSKDRSALGEDWEMLKSRAGKIGGLIHTAGTVLSSIAETTGAVGRQELVKLQYKAGILRENFRKVAIKELDTTEKPSFIDKFLAVTSALSVAVSTVAGVASWFFTMPTIAMVGSGIIFALAVTYLVRWFQKVRQSSVIEIKADYRRRLIEIYTPVISALEEAKVKIDDATYHADVAKQDQFNNALLDAIKKQGEAQQQEVEQLRNRADSLEQENKQLRETMVSLKDGQDQILALLLQRQAQAASNPTPEDTAA